MPLARALSLTMQPLEPTFGNLSVVAVDLMAALILGARGVTVQP
jgi:hypothetical protein